MGTMAIVGLVMLIAGLGGSAFIARGAIKNIQQSATSSISSFEESSGKFFNNHFRSMKQMALTSFCTVVGLILLIVGLVVGI